MEITMIGNWKEEIEKAWQNPNSGQPFDTHNEEFLDVIWEMSLTPFDIPREIQVVVDSNDILYMDFGTPGYVDFNTVPVGMTLPVKCWIHTHPFGQAYFSGTDTDTMEEHASRDGFFFSLVVAHTKTKYAFSMSYLDQYGRPNIIEADEKDIFTALPANPNKEWVAEWKEIKKAYNQAVTVTPGRTYGNQMSLGGNYGMNSWNKSFEVKKAHEVKEEKEKQAKYRILLSKYDMDQIEYDEFAKECKKLGIDELDMYGNEVLSGY